MLDALTSGKRPADITALGGDDSSQDLQLDPQPARAGSAEPLELSWEVGMARTELRQQSLLLAGIVHDLRTPLTVIQLQAQYLRRLLTHRLTSVTAAGATFEVSAASEAQVPRPGTVGAIRSKYEQQGRGHWGWQERLVARPLPPEPPPPQVQSLQMQPLEEVQIGLARITAAVTSMATLVDEVADLLGSQAGYLPELRCQPTDLVALAREVAAAYQFVPGAPLDPAGAQLTSPRRERTRIRVGALEPQVTGDWDARCLRRVLGNLLENAIKYSPGGGDVLVKVGCTRAGPAGEWAILRVRDEGIGIPAADLPTIFEPFRRGRNVAACASKAPGSGLGLVTVRQIVEEHGGAIQVASAPEAGTSFTIHLPRCTTTTASMTRRLCAE
jgi:signal transduction histidine kinase